MPYPVELPPGSVIYLDQGLLIDRPILLRGNGSELRVPEDAIGITLLPDADRSVIQDLRLRGNGVSTESVGIQIQAHGCSLERLHVNRLRIGVSVRSGAAYPNANANANRITGLWVSLTRTGLMLSGPDSNGGLFAGIECVGGERCVYDSSFLGNTFVGVTTHGATVRSVEVDQYAAVSTFLGTYVEGPQRAVRALGNNTIFVGGLAAKHRTEDSRSEAVGMRRSRLRFVEGGLTEMQ
jgi:hypothetical protein